MTAVENNDNVCAALRDSSDEIAQLSIKQVAGLGQTTVVQDQSLVLLARGEAARAGRWPMRAVPGVKEQHRVVRVPLAEMIADGLDHALPGRFRIDERKDARVGFTLTQQGLYC